LSCRQHCCCIRIFSPFIPHHSCCCRSCSCHCLSSSALGVAAPISSADSPAESSADSSADSSPDAILSDSSTSRTGFLPDAAVRTMIVAPSQITPIPSDGNRRDPSKNRSRSLCAHSAEIALRRSPMVVNLASTRNQRLGCGTSIPMKTSRTRPAPCTWAFRPRDDAFFAIPVARADRPAIAERPKV
jgi:hypothetical protein